MRAPEESAVFYLAERKGRDGERRPRRGFRGRAARKEWKQGEEASDLFRSAQRGREEKGEAARPRTFMGKTAEAEKRGRELVRSGGFLQGRRRRPRLVLKLFCLGGSGRGRSARSHAEERMAVAVV